MTINFEKKDSYSFDEVNIIINRLRSSIHSYHRNNKDETLKEAERIVRAYNDSINKIHERILLNVGALLLSHSAILNHAEKQDISSLSQAIADCFYNSVQELVQEEHNDNIPVSKKH